MNFLSLHIEVTDALPREITRGAATTIAAWVFVPAKLSLRPTVVALLNGGTYDKRYFHIEVPGRSGYSLAQHLAEHGHIVILLDHLGIGESSRAAKQMDVTRHVAATANHAALRVIYDRLHAGTLVSDLAPLPTFLKVGGGHSMGGMQTITQQAEHRTYDALLILGYTAIGVHLTIGGALVSADPGPLDRSQPDYSRRDRRILRSTFHWDDVPADVVAVDDALNVDVPYVLSTQSITAGIVADDAAVIDVPVYLCLGERDVSPDPHSESVCYPACRDFTLHILPTSGHCQNFSSTRALMYNRIASWIDNLR